MEYYGALEVIGEESEYDENDTNSLGLCIRYKSDDTNVSATVDVKNKICNGETISLQDKSTNKSSTDKNMSSHETRSSLTDRRRSIADSQGVPRKLKITLEPTYRMEPKPDQYFVWYKVRNTLNKIIAPLFENFSYSSRTAGNYCKMVCTKALSAVKRKHEWPRYRYVCHVTLIQLFEQGVIVGDRSLMLPGIDNYAVCLFKNKEAVLILTFHGIYAE